MSLSLTNFKTRIKTKIRADLSTPTIDDLHDTSITTWGNELVHQVMQSQYKLFMANGGLHEDLATIFNELITYNTSLTFTSGVATRPSGVFSVVNVVVNADSITNRRAELLDLKDFRRWDGRNFALEPTAQLPKVNAGDSIRVKPTSIASGKIDFVKVHPTIASGILVNEIGQEALVLLVMAEYYDFINEHDLANSKRALADKVINDSGKQIKV